MGRRVKHENNTEIPCEKVGRNKYSGGGRGGALREWKGKRRRW